MMKTMRLIANFKKQTRFTIWDHLEALAEDNTVYSAHLMWFDPYFKDKDIYLYSTASELVVLCIDTCGEKDELADEEKILNEPPLYFTSRGHRVSPVWKLSETLKLMKLRLASCSFPVNVYGVLLTNSSILNTDDMKEVWEDMNVKVIDRFNAIGTPKVRRDESLPGKSVVDALFNQTLPPEDNEPMELAELKEFEKLLDEFIKSTSEEDTNEGQDDDIQNTPEEDASFGDNGDENDDISIPNGEVAQNQNVSIRVEILRPIANPREELDKLVGCADIKKRMDELLALTSYNKMMRKLFPGSKQHEVSLHSIFLGSPGTGKTSVCKIFGSLLRKVGALSKGHVVVCDRGTFIGTLWGDEERSIRQVLDMAQGGVLMIDEAYLLNGKNENDPGKLVIQLLMNILADEKQRDIAIVLCGYKEPMQKLLNSNPGLQSRFPNKFEFPDFTIEELQEITQRKVKEYEYQFTPTAWTKYSQLLAYAYQQRNSQTWGNARYIANWLEYIYIQHAFRCVKERPVDKDQMRILTPEDILPIEVPKERNRIGF